MTVPGKGGRPLKFKTPEELQKCIDQYFAECDEKGKPYTVCGMAYALNCSRQTLLNYSEKGAFLDTVTRAKLKIQAYAEEHLFIVKNSNGVQFSLKNNFGWRDKQELEHTGAVHLHFDEQDRKLIEGDED